jgi:hypothetical protein
MTGSRIDLFDRVAWWTHMTSKAEAAEIDGRISGYHEN